MNLEETIIFANNMTKTKYHHGMVQMGKLNDDEANFYFEEAKSYKQLAKWLEELKELREYKRKMKAQFLDDIENPLEPIKLSSALESEIFKYEYRAEHDPQKISPLDYTIIYALKHCLEEQLKEVE